MSQGGKKWTAGELEHAVKVGDMHTLKRLDKNGADLDHVFQYSGYTPLIYAVRRRDNEMVNYLIAKGCNVNLQDTHGETPLFHALQKGCVKGLKALLDAGSDVHHKTYLHSCFDVALERGDVNMMSLLIDYGLNLVGVQTRPTVRFPSFRHNIHNIRSRTSPGFSPVRYVATRYVSASRNELDNQDRATTRRLFSLNYYSIFTLMLPKVDWSDRQLDILRDYGVMSNLCQSAGSFVREMIRYGAPTELVLKVFSDQVQADVLPSLPQYEYTSSPDSFLTVKGFHLLTKTVDFAKLQRACSTWCYSEPQSKRLAKVLPVARKFIKTPPSLQHLCFQRIHKELPALDRMKCIDTLPLPELLKDKLKLI